MDKEDILANFLDALYREIRDMEMACRMQAAPDDLRPPIDVHHDAVRAILSKQQGYAPGQRLSVTWLSHDIMALRQRARWLRSGPHVWWEGRDPHYAKTRDQCIAFKRQLIRSKAEIDIPLEILQQDLADFARRYVNERHLLDGALYERNAQKWARRAGRHHWQAVSGEEFWKGLRYTARYFSSLLQRLAEQGAPGLLAHEAKTQQTVTPSDQLAESRRALKNLWLQIVHPLVLRGSIVPDETREHHYHLDTSRHIPERHWQQMGSEAAELADAYDRYTVMFAAMTADTVDYHYKALLDDLDQQVIDVAALIREIEALERGGNKLELHQLERMVRELENEELKRRLLELLEKYKADTSGNATLNATEAANQVMDEVDQQIDKLEQAHFDFLATQFTVYEESQDVVRKLAGQGLNIAGKFVEAAAAMAAARQQDRGNRGR